MIKKIVKNAKKYWLSLWCIVSAVFILGIFVSAEYMLSSSSMKRVVASTSDQGKMFSSNLLAEGTDPYSYVPRYFQQPDTAVSSYDVDVFLWNHSLTDLLKKYPEDIDYKLSLSFTDSKGDAIIFTDSDSDSKDDTIGERWVRLEKEGEADPIVTLNGGNLSYSSSSVSTLFSTSEQDHYVLKFFGNWDLVNDMDICVKMVATPYPATKYKDISPLGAIIGLAKKQEGSVIDTRGWRAYIAEKPPHGAQNADDCSAYNLIVTGAGQYTITIKWDTTKFECNKNFRNNTVYNFGTYKDDNPGSPTVPEVTYTAPDGGSTIATLTIKGDTSTPLYETSTLSAETPTRLNNRSRYDIQFYKKDGYDPSDWSFFNNEGAAVSGSVYLSVGIEEKPTIPTS